MKSVVRAKLPRGALAITVTERTFVSRMVDMAAADLPFAEAEWWAEPIEEDDDGTV